MALTRVRFRVKIVESTAHDDRRPARLLAVADRLAPQRLDEALQATESLLPLVPASISEVWRVNFPADGGEPALWVNQQCVPSPAALGHSGEFVSLVLPEVLRTVLFHILVVEQYDAGGEGDEWQSLWLRMAENSLGATETPRPERSECGQPSNADELEEWIDAVVAQFAERFQVSRRFTEWWNVGDQA
jgi:hypothetical protein